MHPGVVKNFSAGVYTLRTMLYDSPMSETVKQGDTVLVDGTIKATVLAVATAAQKAMVRPDRDSDRYTVRLDRLTLVR